MKDEIDAYLRDVAKNGLDEKAFERAKKALLGTSVGAYDEPVNIPSIMVEAAVCGHGVFDGITAVKNMTFDYVTKRFNEMFSTDRSALSVVKSK